MEQMNKTGVIVKQKSNLYTVLIDKKTYECHARGKFRHDKVSPLVGDTCVIDMEENYILELLPRKNELNRPPIANVDIAVILTSVKEPNLSLSLLDKELACVLSANISPIICLSKMDLLNKDEKKYVKSIIKYYRKVGFDVITNKDLRKLKKLIKGKTVVLTGQTGAGKSTLLNRIDKTLDLETNEISKALGRGKHTTRHTEIYYAFGAYIADTPGFSALDLHIERDKLKDLYPEFVRCKCKFDDCAHIKAKDCGVIKAYESGKILKTRYENYIKFWSEL